MDGKAILTVSFGTTKDETREKTIGALERAIAARYPEFRVERAFTSFVVIRRLAARGIVTEAPGEALRRLAREGVSEVYIQPTHLMPGEEYEKLLQAAEPFREQFRTLRIAKPLLWHTRDLLAAAEAVLADCPAGPGEALLLMGHGSAHFSNCVYPAMDYVFRQKNSRHVFVATVEGYPEIGETLDALSAGGYRRAVLLPFMLVAGEHAENDMAGSGAESWKNLCLARGIEPRCVLRGLGESPAIQKIYLSHLGELMD